MNIRERLQEAAQAIDEAIVDHHAEAAERYQRLLAVLQDNENGSPADVAKVDFPPTPDPQAVGSLSTPAMAPQPSPTGNSSLTQRQQKVLEVIRDSVQQRGYPPSMREIGEAVGLSSTSSVAHQLMALERKGYLRRDPIRPRTYDVQSFDQATSPRYTGTGGRTGTSAARTGNGSVSHQRPFPGPQPGDKELKKQVRDAWACVEKLRRESDEQRQYLHRKPLTNADLAEHIGKSDRTVSRWLHEQNFMPSRSEFLGIIEKLGGDPDEYDFIWYEGYGAYETLRGMADRESSSRPSPGRQRQLSPAAEG